MKTLRRWVWRLIALWSQHTGAPWRDWTRARWRCWGMPAPARCVREEGDTPESVSRRERALQDFWDDLTQRKAPRKKRPGW